MTGQTVVVHPRSKRLSSFTRSGSKDDFTIPSPGRPVYLNIHKIRQQSHHSQVVAAMNLGISITALKVACRQLGVVSWASLREESSDTQPAAPSATGGPGAPDDADQAPQTQDVIHWKEAQLEEKGAKDVHEPEDCLEVIGVEKTGICNMNIGETIRQGQANETPDVAAACKQSQAMDCMFRSLSQHPAGPTPPSIVPQGHVHDREQFWQTAKLGWQPTELVLQPTMMSPASLAHGKWKLCATWLVPGEEWKRDEFDSVLDHIFASAGSSDIFL